MGAGTSSKILKSSTFCFLNYFNLKISGRPKFCQKKKSCSLGRVRVRNSSQIARKYYAGRTKKINFSEFARTSKNVTKKSNKKKNQQEMSYFMYNFLFHASMIHNQIDEYKSNAYEYTYK